MSFPESSKGQTAADSHQDKPLLTIRGENATIEGKLVVSNIIEIDCAVKGDLLVQGQIVIQKNGFVNANVKTVDATVIGHYEGTMEATGIVEVKDTGVVAGNIKTDSLIIAKGGIFSGAVERITPLDNKAVKGAVDPKTGKKNPFDHIDQAFDKTLKAPGEDKLKL